MQISNNIKWVIALVGVVFAFTITSALAQKTRNALVYEAMTIEQVHNLISEMGEEPKYHNLTLKNADLPDKFITAKIKFTVIISPGFRSCSQKICDSYILSMRAKGIKRNAANLYKLNKVGLSSVFYENGVTICKRVYSLKGGVTARHFKRTVRNFHDHCAIFLRNAYNNAKR